MVIVQIVGENSSGMAGIHDDDLIKALASERSDQPFDVRILPRTSRRAQHLFDAQARHAPTKGFPIDRVAIPEEIVRRALPREGFDQLLACPLRRRILGDVDKNHFAPVMQEYDEDEEHFEVNRGNGKEIDRHAFRQVVLQERAPGWRGCLMWTDSIFLDGRFRDLDAEFA